MIYDLDYYFSIEVEDKTTDLGTHEITFLETTSCEGAGGYVHGWVNNFELTNKEDEKSTIMSFFQGEEDSNYYLFIDAYKDACKKIDVEPVNWR